MFSFTSTYETLVSLWRDAKICQNIGATDIFQVTETVTCWTKICQTFIGVFMTDIFNYKYKVDLATRCF